MNKADRSLRLWLEVQCEIDIPTVIADIVDRALVEFPLEDPVAIATTVIAAIPENAGAIAERVRTKSVAIRGHRR